MKVLAINSSPNLGRGNTAAILDPFLSGLKEAGAEVSLFYATRLKIKPCCGRYHCWFKTPGGCSQRDKMDKLYPLLREADIFVLATPLFVDGMTGPMKMILDRILPIAQPYIEIRDGHCRHPRRAGTKNGKLVLVSNCGFWELDNFEPLVAHVKAICQNLERDFSGALLRPHGPALRYLLENNIPILSARAKKIVQAAKKAGFELATTGEISEDLLATVSQHLIPRRLYLHYINKHFRELEKATTKETSR